jgi:hypothetical protein
VFVVEMTMNLNRPTVGLRAVWGLGLAVCSLAMLAWTVTPCSGAAVRAAPEWLPPAGLLNTMTVHAQVLLPSGGYVTAAGSLLAAFKADSIRGVATLFDGPAAQMQFQLSVGSDLASETGLTLQVYDAGTDTVHALAGTFAFEAEGRIGWINLPAEFQALAQSTVPVANEAAVAVPVGVATPIRLSGTDPQGDLLSFRLDSNPLHGTLSGFDPTTGDLVYTPTAGFSGGDHFDFAVIDRGDVWSAPARVGLTVQTQVLGVFQVSGGNVATIEWGARLGASDGIDNGIDSPAAPGGMDGRNIAFVPPTGSLLLKRDVRGAFLGARWQVAAQAGEAPLTLSWDPAAQPSGNWHLWQLAGKNGAPVPGTAVRLATADTLPPVPAWTARHYALGIPAPIAITAADPSSGLPAGGAVVTVTGSGFSAGASVWFGGSAAAAVTVVDSTTLTVVAPAHARGTVPISVVGADGGSGTLDRAFTYNLPPTALPGGPYTAVLADELDLTLDGRASSSPYAGEALTYGWDLDGNGDYADASGATPTVPWATLAALADAGALTVGQPSPLALRVTDSLGGVGQASTTVTLVDVAPWTFTLTVLSGGSTPQLTVGLRPDATDGVDAGIDVSAPAPAGSAVTVLDGPGHGLVSDFRAYNPVTPPRYVGWVLRLTAGPGEPCLLGWDPAQAAAVGRGGLRLLQMEAGSGGAPPAADGRLVAGGIRIALPDHNQLSIPPGQTAFLRLVFGYVEETLTLAEGWNLFALPMEPLDPVATRVLAATGVGQGAIGPAWIYDGLRQAYLRAAELHAFQGTWIYVPAAAGVALRLQGIPVSDRDYPLGPGGTWQLTGVARSRALEANADLAPPVQTWDATAQAYRRLQPGDALTPGAAYWFCLRQATVLR